MEEGGDDGDKIRRSLEVDEFRDDQWCGMESKACLMSKLTATRDELA